MYGVDVMYFSVCVCEREREREEHNVTCITVVYIHA